MFRNTLAAFATARQSRRAVRETRENMSDKKNDESRTVVRYSHNNSGGYDWLDADDWAALAAAGWVLGRSINNRVYDAERTGLTLDAAVAEWKSITGQDPAEDGCECCGPPHSFYVDLIISEDVSEDA